MNTEHMFDVSTVFRLPNDENIEELMICSVYTTPGQTIEFLSEINTCCTFYR